MPSIAAMNNDLVSRVALLILLLAVVHTQVGRSQEQTQECSSQLSALNVCGPFVVPGAPNTYPNSQCCNALQAVNHDCICNTFRIASRLPSQCNIPAATCGSDPFP